MAELKLEDRIFVEIRSYEYLHEISRNGPISKILVKVSDIIEMLNRKIDVVVPEKWISEIHRITVAHNMMIDTAIKNGLPVRSMKAVEAQKALEDKIFGEALVARKELKESSLVGDSRYSNFASRVKSELDGVKEQENERISIRAYGKMKSVNIDLSPPSIRDFMKDTSSLPPIPMEVLPDIEYDDLPDLSE